MNARKSPNYNSWRRRVKRRDDAVCRKCNVSYNLHVHHIRPLRKYPEFALAIENGLTLCEKCHKKLQGKEETTDLRTFLGGRDTKIVQQIKSINATFPIYLGNRLRSTTQRTRDDAAWELMSYLDLYPNSLSNNEAMVPLLVRVVYSYNRAEVGTIQQRAIEWLKQATGDIEVIPCRCGTMQAPVWRESPMKNGDCVKCTTCFTSFEYKSAQSGAAPIRSPHLTTAIQAISWYERCLEEQQARWKREVESREAAREAERAERWEKISNDIVRWWLVAWGIIIGLFILGVGC